MNLLARRAACLAFVLAFAASAFSAEPSPPARPWEAAVRLKVALGNGQLSCGSGTVIASRPDVSFIVTCAHIFEHSRKGDPVQVDLFDGQLVNQQVHFAGTIQGRCVDFDRVTDVGLVSVAPGRVLPSCPPVPAGWLPHKGERLIAVGCASAEDAIAWTCKAIRRTGAPGSHRGIECTGTPYEGRSGGGLHRADGRLAGVCDFRTESATGIYAEPASIHALLDRNGLSDLYRETAKRPAPKAGTKPKPEPEPERRPFATPDPPAVVTPAAPSPAASAPAVTPPPARPVVPAPPPAAVAPTEAPAQAETGPPGSGRGAGPDRSPNRLVLIAGLAVAAVLVIVLVSLALYFEQRNRNRDGEPPVPLFKRKPKAAPAAPAISPEAPTAGASVVRSLAVVVHRREEDAKARAEAEAREAKRVAEAQRDEDLFEKILELVRQSESEAPAAPVATDPKAEA